MKLPSNYRPSRLQKCPCGSGRRFRDCHGHPNRPADLPFHVDYGPAPPELVALVREHERKRRDFEDKHGQVRPIIASEFAGQRLVAVGSTIHYAEQEDVKVFPDFLNNYVHSVVSGLFEASWLQSQC